MTTIRFRGRQFHTNRDAFRWLFLCEEYPRFHSPLIGCTVKSVQPGFYACISSLRPRATLLPTCFLRRYLRRFGSTRRSHFAACQSRVGCIDRMLEADGPSAVKHTDYSSAAKSAFKPMTLGGLRKAAFDQCRTDIGHDWLGWNRQRRSSPNNDSARCNSAQEAHAEGGSVRSAANQPARAQPMPRNAHPASNARSEYS